MQSTNNTKSNTGSSVRDFIRYNNAVPLFVAIGIVLSGSAFAATDTGQQAISNTVVGQQETVISVDNTLISTIDLATWTPRIRVTGMTEDTDTFYVTYTLSTIDIVDFKWQYTDKTATLKVSKDVLKDYVSLSDYVKFQLKENIDAENDRLARTQEIEKKNITLKQTVTSYSGLAGLVLDENTLVEPPVAVIPESETPGIPAPEVPAQPVEPIVPVVDTPVQNTPVDTTPVETSTTTAPVTEPTTSTSTPPVIDTTVIDNVGTTTEATTPPVETPVTPPIETTPTPVVEQPVPTEVPAPTSAPEPVTQTETPAQTSQ